MRRPRKLKRDELAALPPAAQKRMQWLEKEVAGHAQSRSERILEQEIAVWYALRTADRTMAGPLRLRSSDLVRVALKKQAGPHPHGWDVWNEE